MESQVSRMVEGFLLVCLAYVVQGHLFFSYAYLLDAVFAYFAVTITVLLTDSKILKGTIRPVIVSLVAWLIFWVYSLSNRFTYGILDIPLTVLGASSLLAVLTWAFVTLSLDNMDWIRTRLGRGSH